MTNSHGNIVGSPLPSKVNYPEMTDPKSGFNIASDEKGIALKSFNTEPLTPTEEPDFYSLRSLGEGISPVNGGMFLYSASEQEILQNIQRYQWHAASHEITNNNSTSPINKVGDSFVLEKGYVYEIYCYFSAKPLEQSTSSQSLFFRIGDANLGTSFGDLQAQFAEDNNAQWGPSYTQAIVRADEQMEISVFYFTLCTDQNDYKNWTIWNGQIGIKTVAKIKI